MTTEIYIPKYKISDTCVSLVKTFEGFRSEAYKCPAGVWTIGYGHTEDVKAGDKITEPQATFLLRNELDEFAIKVEKLLKKATQSQFDALVSFAYNVGVSALASSTLLKKHNAGDYEAAQKEFLKWNKAAGKELAGLTKRRLHESALYGS